MREKKKHGERGRAGKREKDGEGGCCGVFVYLNSRTDGDRDWDGFKWGIEGPLGINGVKKWNSDGVFSHEDHKALAPCSTSNLLAEWNHYIETFHHKALQINAYKHDLVCL